MKAMFWAFCIGVIAFVVLTMSPWRIGNSTPPTTLRLKATATILVDGEPYSGSSVQEFQLRWIYEPQIGRTGAWRVVARGEAIRIDVPGGDPIFVLMTTSSSSANYGYLLESQCTIRGGSVEDQAQSFVEFQRCSLKEFPKAVRFDEVVGNDVVEPVYVDGKNRGDYRFISMTFEQTLEPVTTGRVPVNIWTDKVKYLKAPYMSESGETMESSVGDLSFKSELFW